MLALIPSRELIRSGELVAITLIPTRELVPSSSSATAAAVHVGPGVLVVGVPAANVDVLVVRIHTSLKVSLFAIRSEVNAPFSHHLTLS